MMSEQRVEIQMQVQGYDGGRTRQTTVTQANRVLLNYITPEIAGTAATHWRTVVERLSFFITEDEARSTAVAVARDDERRQEIDELRRDNEVMRQARDSWLCAFNDLAGKHDKLLLDSKPAARKRGAKKQPARKRARK